MIQRRVLFFRKPQLLKRAGERAIGPNRKGEGADFDGIVAVCAHHGFDLHWHDAVRRKRPPLTIATKGVGVTIGLAPGLANVINCRSEIGIPRDGH